MTDMELDSGIGRTYRYYAGPTIYPFGGWSPLMVTTLSISRCLCVIPLATPVGYGLSLTSFTLNAQNFPTTPTFQAEASPTAALNFSVIVHNAGQVAGDEVVQVNAGLFCIQESRFTHPSTSDRGRCT